MCKLHDKISMCPGGVSEKRSHVWSVIDGMFLECFSIVQIEGCSSSKYQSWHGPREGAVLSPILNAIHIDGICSYINDC